MPKFTVSFSDDAKKDLQKIVNWYNKIDPQITLRLISDLKRTQEILASTPYIYQEFFLFVHRTTLKKFPFKIFYVPDEIDFEVNIIAILHEKQDENVIKKRINFE